MCSLLNYFSCNRPDKNIWVEESSRQLLSREQEGICVSSQGWWSAEDSGKAIWRVAENSLPKVEALMAEKLVFISLSKAVLNGKQEQNLVQIILITFTENHLSCLTVMDVRHWDTLSFGSAKLLIHSIWKCRWLVMTGHECSWDIKTDDDSNLWNCVNFKSNELF